MPEFSSCACIDSKGVIGRREIEDTIDHQRNGFDAAAGKLVGALASNSRACRTKVRAMDPCERHVLHVRRVDLLQGAVVASGVVSVIRRPWVDRRFQERRRSETFLPQNKCEQTL